MALKSLSRRRLVSAGFLIIIIAGLVGVLWVTNVFGWRAWRVQEAEAFIGASLPGGAANIHFATQNQKTRIVWLRFDLPPDADLTRWLTQADIQTPLRDNFTPFPAANPQEAAYTWWDAPAIASDYAGLYDNTGQKTIEVLLDKEHHTLYLRAYALAGN